MKDKFYKLANFFDALGKYSLVVAVIAFLWNMTPMSEVKKEVEKQTVYQAWQTISIASTSGGAGGVKLALNELILHQQSLEGLRLHGVWLKDFDFTRTLGKSLIEIELGGSNLKDCRFDGLNLKNSTLSSNFSGVSFIGADLRHSNLENSALDDSDLTDADFGAYENVSSGAMAIVGTSSILKNVSIKNSILDRANFGKAKMQSIKIVNSTSIESNYSQASMKDAVLSGTNFKGSQFLKTDLENADFTYSIKNLKKGAANLESADLSGANLQNANMSAKLPQVTAFYLLGLGSDFKAPPVSLKNANLIGTNFKGANLKGAIFSGSTIGESEIFGRTDFSGANLKGAKGLSKEMLKLAVIDDKTILP